MKRPRVSLATALALVAAFALGLAVRFVGPDRREVYRGLLDQATRAYERRELDLAAQYYERARQLAPGDYRPYQGLAAAERHGGRFDAAVALYTRAIACTHRGGAARTVVAMLHRERAAAAIQQGHRLQAAATPESVAGAGPYYEAAARDCAMASQLSGPGQPGRWDRTELVRVYAEIGLGDVAAAGADRAKATGYYRQVQHRLKAVEGAGGDSDTVLSLSRDLGARLAKFAAATEDEP